MNPFKTILNKNVIYYIIAICIITLPLFITSILSNDSIVSTPIKKIFFVLFGLSFFSVFMALIRPKLILFIFFPFTILAIIEIYTVFTLKSGVNAGLLSTFFATNRMEVTELLISNKIFVAISVLIISSYIFLTINTPLRFKLHPITKKGLLIFFAIIQTIIISRDIKISMRSAPDDRFSVIKYNYNVKLGKTFPINWFINTNNYVISRSELAKYQSTIKDFRFGAIEKEPITQKKRIVLVIGETARRHNFSIYGYSKETTPRLKQEPNLIAMTNAEAVYNLTSKAYPVFLTRATSDEFDICMKEPSVIKAFQEAGFKTIYINNQPLGYGSIYYQYAHQADSLIDLKPSLDISCNDAPILNEFQKIVDDLTDENVFIVIHSLGSHFRYNLRYPASFEKFTPAIDNSLDLANINNEMKDKLINSYDNSILFTDHFLSGLISSLKKDTSMVSLMMYASDHGENLFDDSNNQFAHGGSQMTRYEKEIPLLIWSSDTYNKTYAEKIKHIRENINTKITTNHFFHSILDLSGIEIDEQTAINSFASEEFQPILPTKNIIKDNIIGIK